ncbi:MAG TPA: hypothetical protein VEB19_08130 [Gemmatimonadaceae bacterium]|nr:hypothetical protein [Gemmatimonadaceae bacterium]
MKPLLALWILLATGCSSTPKPRKPQLVCDVYAVDVSNHLGMDVEIMTASRTRREQLLGYVRVGETRTFELPQGSGGVWARRPGGGYINMRREHNQRLDVKIKCLE